MFQYVLSCVNIYRNRMSTYIRNPLNVQILSCIQETVVLRHSMSLKISSVSSWKRIITHNSLLAMSIIILSLVGTRASLHLETRLPSALMKVGLLAYLVFLNLLAILEILFLIYRLFYCQVFRSQYQQNFTSISLCFCARSLVSAGSWFLKISATVVSFFL